MISTEHWGDITRTERPDFDFDQRSGAREVMESLGVMNLDGFGIDLEHPALGPAGAVLVYAQDVLKENRKPQPNSRSIVQGQPCCWILPPKGTWRSSVHRHSPARALCWTVWTKP